MTAVLERLRRRVADARRSARGRWPVLGRVVEWSARIGYGARGFVYLSVGFLALLAATDRIGDAVGSRGAAMWLEEQPFGRLWLVALGLGLWAFVGWRVLQSVFDADREGATPKAWAMRAGQAMSGLFYGVLAASVFELIDELETAPDDLAENRAKAEQLLALPFGSWMLVGVGLVILSVGIGNIVRGARSDFAEALSCSADICRRVTPLARAGYMARGVAYLPLAAFVILAGINARADQVGSFGEGLAALEAQPGGAVILGLTAVGLMAFGAFAFVEARWRRIRPPRELNPL